MAFTRLKIDGYGQVELNQVAFRRDGRIEAQCALGTDFSAVPAENGMLLEVDNVARKVNKPSSFANPIALNYTAEHMYDERANALKDFALEQGSFYPRLGYLAEGDKFTTNCLCYDKAVAPSWADDAAVLSALDSIASAPVYGGACSEGAINLTTTKPTQGPVLKVIKKTTMPDGTIGVKFQVL